MIKTKVYYKIMSYAKDKMRKIKRENYYILNK